MCLTASSLLLALTAGPVAPQSRYGVQDELVFPAPRFDCNGNGLEDSEDIANGLSSDSNLNGIPDECERTGLRGALGFVIPLGSSGLE